MAKIILLVSLLLYIVVAEAIPLPAKEWSAATEKSISAMKSKLTKALEEVVLAAPPAKRPEVQKATLEHMAVITALLAKAHATGDEKKAINIASSFEEAAELIIGAPSDQKFDAMLTTFSVALTPDPTKCPTVDKSYCEAYSKLKKAQDEVISTAPPAKSSEIKNAVLSQGFAAGEAISKAYLTGEENEIAAVLIAYSKAADAVIAAPPAEKFKVLEETFTAANKASSKPPAVAEAAQVPLEKQSAATADKSIEAMKLKLAKALDEVALATPPAKKLEVQKAILEHTAAITVLIAKAQAAGDEKKAIDIARSFEEAAELIIAAPPDQKFDAMQTTFSVAFTPDPRKCPNVDKLYCEAYSKLKKAQDEVISTAPPAKASEIKDAVLTQGFAAGEAISKAYTTGEEKDISRVLTAYSKAADAVIAAPPAEKFKVLEETFKAANKA